MQVRSNTIETISPNYTTPTGVQDYMNSDKNLKKESEDKETKENSKSSSASDELSDDEKRLVNDLQSRDAEVRTHEAAHQAAGGGMTGRASYSYQQGPDGKMYAIGGEVSISFKSASSPEETISNAAQVIAAAMAPSSPSGQDFAVASSARVMQMKAEQQLNREKQEELIGKEIYKDSYKTELQKNTNPKNGLDIPT